MKRAVLPVSVIILLLTGCARSPEWAEFLSEEGGFRVMMPGEPREVGFRFSPDDSTGTVEFRTFKARSPGHRYTVTYTTIEDEDFEELMNFGFEMKWGDWEVGDREITFDGYPGKETTFKRRNRTVISRSYVIEGYYYCLSASYKNRRVCQEDVDRFFNSFKLLMQRD